MNRTRIAFAFVAAALGLALAGCGGGNGDVPGNAVAVVDGIEIPRADLDVLVAQAKKSYEATKQEFPKVGTSEYQQIQQQYVAFLVQKTEFEQAAEELDIAITDKDVDKERSEFLKSRFEGNEKKLEEALEAQGLTAESFRDTLRVSVLSRKIFEAVTKDVKVTDAEVQASYATNQEQYRTRESREVRHILVSKKKANGDVDFAKSKQEADRIYAQLQGGADFAQLAKQLSDDPGSKDSGGKLTIARGETVPEFEATSFELKTGAISRPVKSQFGYHVIQAVSDAKPARVTPLAQVKDSIKATMLQDKKNETMTKWVQDLQKRYEGKVSYAAGFAPPDIPESTETETTETE